MLPDSIVVNNFVSVDYENNKQGSGAKISELYANLKYVKITLTNTGHKDHIHMSFSPERGGIYVDESGSLSAIPVGTSSPGQNTSAGDKNLGVPVDMSNLKKVYTSNNALTPAEVYELLMQFGNFSPQVSAIFTAICQRESSYRPRAINQYGFYGLFQIGTSKPTEGSDLDVDLTLPSPYTTKNWKLALSDKANDSLTADQIREEILRRGATTNQAELLAGFDQNAFIPANQMRVLRAKIGRKNYQTTVDDYVFRAWGEGFLKDGFISGVKYSIAKDVYVKAGNKADDLKSWVLNNVPRSDSTWYKFADADHSEKFKLEAWVNEEVILGIQYGSWKNGVFTASSEIDRDDNWLI